MTSPCRLQAKAVLHNEAVSQVQTLLALLEAVTLTLPPQAEARTPLAYERHFVYCLAWSIGGLLDPGDRRLFDAHLRSLKRDAMPQASCYLCEKRWRGCWDKFTFRRAQSLLKILSTNLKLHPWTRFSHCNLDLRALAAAQAGFEKECFREDNCRGCWHP